MEQKSNPNRRHIVLRLLRIVLIAFVLLMLAIVMNPRRYLPPDMTLGEFFQGMLGALMLAGVMASVVFRAWNDYQRKKREKNESR
jgi:RsiW-degrading membrane proteinase PrsW (M82 family)